MCILFIYRNPNANSESYRLILVANRDEYFKRAALPAHYWKNHPVCLGGKLKLPLKLIYNISQYNKFIINSFFLILYYYMLLYVIIC